MLSARMKEFTKILGAAPRHLGIRGMSDPRNTLTNNDKLDVGLLVVMM